MDPLKNPFSPGAGFSPPLLIGREAILEQARILLGRVQIGRSEKSLLLIGRRGMGKTILLKEFCLMARNSAYHTVFIEVAKNKSLRQLIAPQLYSILIGLNRVPGDGDRIQRGLRILCSFTGELKFEDLELPPNIKKGEADTDDIEQDLPDLFEALGEAMKENRGSLAILIDEIQCLSKRELGAVIMAMHRIQQRQLPVALLGAGLPGLPRLVANLRPYAERLFTFSDL